MEPQNGVPLLCLFLDKRAAHCHIHLSCRAEATIEFMNCPIYSVDTLRIPDDGGDEFPPSFPDADK